MFRLCNREPGNNFRQILTAPLSGRPHLLFDRPSWRSQHIYSLWRPHRHGNFLLPTSNDGFLRATVRSDWMTVVWDWVEMEGKNTGGGNTAVVGVKDKRGSLFLDIYSDIWDLLRLWNIFSEFINWMTTLQHHLSSMNQQAFKAHKAQIHSIRMRELDLYTLQLASAATRWHSQWEKRRCFTFKVFASDTNTTTTTLHRSRGGRFLSCSSLTIFRVHQLCLVCSMFGRGARSTNL